MDVLLVLHTLQRQLLDGLTAAPGQVAIQLALEELAHVLSTVLLLHHHQCRILRQRLGQHGCTLHVGADHLVRPPLVRHFVGGHVEHIVHLVRVAQVGDEADRLRIGNGVGEGLGEALVARELDDAYLAMLVRSEVGFVVGQRLLYRVDHAVHVVAMGGIEIHLDRDVLVLRPANLPACRQVGVEVQHRPVHRIAEAAPPVHRGLVLQVARRQRHLVRCRADGAAEVEPVGIVGDVGVRACGFVFQLGHAPWLAEVTLATLVAVADLNAFVVAEGRQYAAVEEAAVVDDVAWRLICGDAMGLLHHTEMDAALFARLQRRSQAIDAVAEVGVVHRQRLSTQVDGHQLFVVGHGHVHLLDGRGMGVADRPVGVDHHRLGLGMQVHPVVHGDDARLRQVAVLRQFAFVTGLQVQLLVR
ncbi:hypothetical protein D3C81_750730 [compost metagenome]